MKNDLRIDLRSLSADDSQTSVFSTDLEGKPVQDAPARWTEEYAASGSMKTTPNASA